MGELAAQTVALREKQPVLSMLMGIEAIGSDLEFRGSVAAPTLLIREMTVSGQ